MKLWLKVSLISIIMTLVATCICNLVLLIRTGNSQIDAAIQNTLRTLNTRVGSWQVIMESETNRNLDTLSERSLAQYLISSMSDSNTALAMADEMIYNTVSVNPQDYLEIEPFETRYIITDIDGYSILITGKQINIKSSPYTLYQMEDVTSVFDNSKKTAYQFAAISLAVVVVVGFFIIFLVRFLMRPVETLKKNAAMIADGVYDQRAYIAGNDEIGELAETFNKMADAVQNHIENLHLEAERRTLLMSALTHELKTPLTSISGNAQTLLRTKLNESEREEALLMIDSECTRVERLSQKLMQLIVLRRTEDILMKPQDMDAFFQSISASCTAMLQKVQMHLTIENHITTLLMDEDLMSSLILNLIDNAVKSSFRDCVIEIIANENTIKVKDHGKGIPKDAIPQLTQPFFMVDKSRAKKAGGIGLGLALAEEIARLHNARLCFESKERQGTIVTVIFDEK